MNRERFHKSAISVAWATVDRARRPPPRLTILYYHGIPDACAETFEAQMAYLARTANLVHADYAGPLDPRKPTVAVTFDDAFRSVRLNGLPAMVRHGIPATIFVPAAWAGRSPGWPMETAGDRDEVVMSPDELRDLPANLIRIGSHSMNHPYLSQISHNAIAEELTRSREVLETIMRTPVDTLAFPFGDYDDRVLALAEDIGYRHLYSVVPQAIRQGDTTILRGRTPTYPTDPLWVFALKTKGAFDWISVASHIKRRLKVLRGGSP